MYIYDLDRSILDIEVNMPVVAPALNEGAVSAALAQRRRSLPAVLSTPASLTAPPAASRLESAPAAGNAFEEEYMLATHTVQVHRSGFLRDVRSICCNPGTVGL